MQRVMPWLLGTCLAACFALLSYPVDAACVELKNDNFEEGKGTAVTAIRSFCISEYHGTIFKAEQDLTLQKIRILVSGDGKNSMENTTLKLIIYKEKIPSTNEPGEELFSETAYQVPPTGQTKPQWLEIDQITTKITKGTMFRVVFAHGLIDCELRVTGEPLCAEACNWWGATADTGPIKANANIVLGKLFKCEEVTERKWRYWKDIPTNCRPKGNLIIRAMAYDGVGPDCIGGGVPTGCTDGQIQECPCAGGTKGTQTCTSKVWGACNGCTSEPPKACTPGATQKCVCTKGDGVQTCKSDGSAWETCECTEPPVPNKCEAGTSRPCKCPDGGDSTEKCNTDGSAWEACDCPDKPQPTGKPEVEKITPNEGFVGKNVDVTIVGKNFVDGAKVKVGSNLDALNVVVVGPTTITAVIPAEASVGEYNITVINPDGNDNSLLNGFSVTTPPGCNCAIQPTPNRIPGAALLWLLLFGWWGFRRTRSR